MSVATALQEWDDPMTGTSWLVGTQTTGGHLRFSSRELALMEAHGWANGDQCEVIVWECDYTGQIIEIDSIIKPSEYFYGGY